MNQPKLLDVPPYQEKLGAGYCGPAVLKMILGYYGIEKSEDELAQLAGTTLYLGTSNEAIKQVLEQHGLTVEIKNNSTFEDIEQWLKKGVPVIVDWFSSALELTDTADGHYSVVVGLNATHIYIQDPETGGLRTFRRGDFMRVWFDFKGESITSWVDMIVRQLIAAYLP